MKRQIILIFILIVTTLSAFNKRGIENGYIKFYYSGDQSKPYPRILLYLAGSLESLNDSISTHKLEISKESFEAIRKAIEERNNTFTDSSLLNSNCYQYIISNNGETTIFLTPYLPRVRQLFSIITNQLKNTNEERAVKEQMANVINRLIYDNKINIH
jgi:hypothetical protein